MTLTTVNPALLDTQAQYTGMKSRIINGNMTIDQRNAGASVTPTATGYTLDRWSLEIAQASKLSIQQNAGAVTPPVGFANYLGATTVSAYTAGTSEVFALRTFVEGFNFADMSWGTANAASVTLSFWVRSSLTGTFGGVLRNDLNNRSYPYTYTISAANTWEQKAVTIIGDTSGTWEKTNQRGVGVFFSLGAGATVSGTAGAWAGVNYSSATGATSVVGTSGATFYITGVQLEKGSTATAFDYRPYGTELALCQRYYQKTYAQSATPGSITSGQSGALWSSVATTNSYPQIGYWSFPVTMRATPTVVLYNPNTGAVGSFIGDSATFANASVGAAGERGISAFGSNVSVGTSVFVSVHATASAEL